MKNKLRTNRLQGLQAHATKTVNDLITEAYAKGYEDGKGEAQFDEAMDQVATIKSANQQRAELIQRAREFVDEHTRLKGPDGNYDVPYMRIETKNLGIFDNVYPLFRVDEEKRTVVLLLKGAHTKKVLYKGIAKCMPNEVFNGWIGKAIALARALEIDVPVEFLEAVQPDSVSVGMKVKSKYTGFDEYYECTIAEISETEVRYKEGGFDFIQKVDDKEFTIIDDSSAKYEVS